MEIGLIFAVLVAVSYGLSDIFARRGVLRAGESYTIILCSLFIGILYFSSIITIRGEWNILWHMPGQSLKLLVSAGILHLVAGRFLYYASVRRIGANKAGTISRIEIPLAATMGIIILNEMISSPLVLGVLCIVTGVVLAGLEKKLAGNPGITSDTYHSQSSGILLALGAGLFWGVSGVFIRPALQQIGSPYVGALISYSSAFVIITALLFRQGHRAKIARLNRSALLPLILNGLLTSTANLFKYVALSLIPVSLVMPVAATHIVYLLIFSFILNRKIEVFTPKVITGILLVAAGTIIISF